MTTHNSTLKLNRRELLQALVTHRDSDRTNVHSRVEGESDDLELAAPQRSARRDPIAESDTERAQHLGYVRR